MGGWGEKEDPVAFVAAAVLAHQAHQSEHCPAGRPAVLGSLTSHRYDTSYDGTA